MNIIGKRNWFFAILGILIIPGIIALFLWGLKPGIDFSGGTLIELNFPNSQKVTSDQIQKSLQPLNLENLQVQMTGDNTVLIRTKLISNDEFNKINDALTKGIGETKQIRFETVGPTISKNLTKNAIISVIIASLAIILYIAFSFRKVSAPANSFRFGVTAVLALIHDLLFVIGMSAILGHFFNFEIDALFITALLTIMGFSVHDTIVVFDRIRENLRIFANESFEEVANKSVNQTLARSINTSLTVLLVLLSLYIFGGETIRNFVLTLLIGIFIGTYSSIFNATPLLVVWQNWVERRKKK